MADQPQDQAPEGMETKDAQLTFRPAPVPNENRTGSQLSDDEREQGASSAGGVGHDSGGAQSAPASGGSARKSATPRAASKDS
jgi:hypothetical protein